MKDIEVQHDFFHSDVDWVDVTERREVKVVRVMVDTDGFHTSVYFTADDLRAMLSAIEST